MIALPVYVVGLVVSGAAFQDKLSVAAVVMGWGIREVAVMINTVAVCASLLPAPGFTFVTEPPHLAS